MCGGCREFPHYYYFCRLLDVAAGPIHQAPPRTGMMIMMTFAKPSSATKRIKGFVLFDMIYGPGGLLLLL